MNRNFIQKPLKWKPTMLALGGAVLKATRRASVRLFAGLLLAAPGFAQLTPEDIAELQHRGQDEGWTFTVGENPATEYPLESLCGLVAPDNWWIGARFDPCTSEAPLPDSFDWRDLGGVTPVKDQNGVGTCWAFATVGVLECNIRIKDRVTRDLSEQWLVSCNREGWSCAGGWFAHDYHQWKEDPCGGTGAVMESDFPYTASDDPCDCPYPHRYLIDDWAYIGSWAGIPSVNAIKQAIMDYGPVSVAMYADDVMKFYTGGIFNACGNGPINHAVVLVGWDDDQAGGVWFMRNSWGPGWGEDGGYMRIPYGCRRIGYAACYVDYAAPPVVIDTVPVRNPRNAPDTRYADPGFGAVDYVYAIGEFEIKAGQYTEFLNAVAATDTYELYRKAMWSDEWGCKIKRSGSIGSYTYSVPADCAYRPVNYISWGDAARFANWLHNGQPEGPPCSWTTEDGAYLLAGAMSNAELMAVVRKPGATWVIPTEDEWYKAAYHKNDGVTGNYFDYPTSSDSPPSNDPPSPDPGNSANFYQDGYTIGDPYWRTRVGAFYNSYSPYYTFDQGGNVWEWNETMIAGWARGYRGGSFATHGDFFLRASYRGKTYPTLETSGNGFRVCKVLPTYPIGDLDCNFRTDFGDINAFFLALTDPAGYAAAFPDCDIMNADINGDGEVDFGDINPFVWLLVQP